MPGEGNQSFLRLSGLWKIPSVSPPAILRCVVGLFCWYCHGPNLSAFPVRPRLVRQVWRCICRTLCGQAVLESPCCHGLGLKNDSPICSVGDAQRRARFLERASKSWASTISTLLGSQSLGTVLKRKSWRQSRSVLLSVRGPPSPRRPWR